MSSAYTHTQTLLLPRFVVSEASSKHTRRALLCMYVLILHFTLQWENTCCFRYLLGVLLFSINSSAFCWAGFLTFVCFLWFVYLFVLAAVVKENTVLYSSVNKLQSNAILSD
jgi:hypothetical protein